MPAAPTPGRSWSIDLASIRRQYLLNCQAKFRDRKWLRQTNLVLLLEKFSRALADDVAGDENDAVAQRRVDRARAFVNLLAVQAGHFPVAQRHVVLFFRDAAQGSDAVGRNIHLVTLRRERLAHHLQNGFLIVNYQHAL